MRQKITFNENWTFTKPGEAPQAVDLPHTWNAADGTDGGNDYYRGTCTYKKSFAAPQHTTEEEVWLEFEGAAMTAVISLNGQELGRHEGGYSTFRVNLTPTLAGENGIKEFNELVVTVDNSANDHVYPQKADFTFYGGLYRDVHLVVVPKSHLALGMEGTCGLKITPKVSEDLTSAEVLLEAFCENTPDGTPVRFGIAEPAGVAADVPVEAITEAAEGKGRAEVQVAAEMEAAAERTAGVAVGIVENGYAKAVITLTAVHLWDGTADPYLYHAEASLPDENGGDAVTAAFGCRQIAFRPDTGFWLNGRNVRLVGTARHQDCEGLGNALTAAQHEEDIRLILEMGANTVRLAHYQHAQYFYDLCDRYGLVVWAEIPYITQHLPNGKANTLSQMTELVKQNYNHPSIICWGLSNEITASGGVSEDMVENHKALNDLCHELDATRPTTMAHVFMLDPNDPFVQLPDICSYNLYYGWYLGELGQNDEFFDTFHSSHPDRVIGLSEYGADANPAYQSGKPERGDWSESYQAEYHEHMLQMWAERPYIWAMHVWNGFDFGADGREEGGKPGQNQKGLVTFDRKLKKDAYYIYKAYLSQDPFVHLCGRRYVNRTEEQTEIKVYSNQKKITLLVDGEVFGQQEGDKIFRFRVPITGTHRIEAVCERGLDTKESNAQNVEEAAAGADSLGKTRDALADACHDTMTITKVEKPDAGYRAAGQVENWFDKPEELVKEGYYSIMDSMTELQQNPKAAALLARIMEKAKSSYGDVARNIEMPEAVQRQMAKMPLQALLKQAGKAVTPAMVQQLNAALNQIKKEG